MVFWDFKVLIFDVVGMLIDFEGGMFVYLCCVVFDSKVIDEDFFGVYWVVCKCGQIEWYFDDLVLCWYIVVQQFGLFDIDVLVCGFCDLVVEWLVFFDLVEVLQWLSKCFKFVIMINV